MGIFSQPQMMSPPPPPPLPPAANPPVYAGSDALSIGAQARSRAAAQGGTAGGDFGTGVVPPQAQTAAKTLVGA